MSYVVYTKSSTVEYPVVFKCECCGKYNVNMNPFTVKESYNTRGVLTQTAVDRRARQADESIRVQKANLFDKIVEDTYKRKVKDTGYTGVCTNCGTVPKWSSFRNESLEKLCRIINFIAFMLAAILLYFNDLFWTNWIFLPIGMFAAVNISLVVLYAVKTIKVKKMDEEFLPIVCENADELEEILKKITLNQKVSVKVPNRTHPAAAASMEEGWMCTCGKKHAAYESSCVCGMSKTAVKLQNQKKE